LADRLNTGILISGLGHASVLGLLLFGPVFSAEPLKFEEMDVTIISGEEFAALLPPVDEAPSVNEAPEAVAPPAPEVVEPPAPDVEEPEVVEAPTPEQQAPPEPDPAPDTSQIQPLPETVVEETPPQEPQPPEVADQVVLLPPSNLRPKARPSERIAPEAVAPSEPDVALDTVVQDAVTEDADATDVAEAQDATAPEEASTEIVTEAETPSGAPEKSLRPKTRPRAPVQTAQPATDTDTSVASALEQALIGAADSVADVPTGPPLTRGEKDALVVAVGNCWNVGSLSTDALQVTVTVGFSMEQDARPVSRSIRLVSSEGGSGDAVTRAFDAARRAVLRCGARGYNLPVEKYDQWKEIEITFNPERMRIK
jgi:hypothetical protein